MGKLSVSKVFDNINNHKTKWVELVTAKVGNESNANDIYQECNLKILEILTSEKKRIEDIASDNKINNCYYYKLLMSCAYNHLRENSKSKINRFIDVSTIELPIEPDEDNEINIDLVFNSGINNLDLLIDNKIASIPLMEIARNRNTNFVSIQRKVTTAMSELKTKLNG